jgi:hypothetical protein
MARREAKGAWAFSQPWPSSKQPQEPSEEMTRERCRHSPCPHVENAGHTTVRSTPTVTSELFFYSRWANGLTQTAPCPHF